MEQRFYDLVAHELQTGFLNPGLWTRAYSETNGDERRAKATYIRLRASELEIIDREQRLAEDLEARRQKEEEVRREREKKATESGLQPSVERELWPMLILAIIVIVIGVVMIGRLGGS